VSNYALRQESLWRSEDIASLIFNPLTPNVCAGGFYVLDKSLLIFVVDYLGKNMNLCRIMLYAMKACGEVKI